MLELDEHSAPGYAVQHGLFPPSANLTGEFLTGGVSNVVLRITDQTTGRCLILKQVREQLRTAVEWHSRPDRIWREVAALRMLSTLVPTGAVPDVLYEDRNNFVFAMTAVPREHIVWKQDLLQGIFASDLFRQAGDFLGRVHSGTWNGAGVPDELRDQQVFDELRLDPYYRWIAREHPDLCAELNELIHATSTAADCLTLADFSPKNILVWEGRITVVDFETAHLGDPAFDLGFFLTHLVLKTVHGSLTPDVLRSAVATFLEAYRSRFASPSIPDGIEAQAMRHLAACLLARVDGKSPVDYLTASEQSFVRSLARHLIKSPAADWLDFESQLQTAMAARP